MDLHHSLFKKLYLFFIVLYFTSASENLNEDFPSDGLLREQSSSNTLPSPPSSRSSELEDKRKNVTEESHTSATFQQSLLHRPPSPPAIQLSEVKYHDSKKEAPRSDENQPFLLEPAVLRIEGTRHRKDKSKDLIENFSEEETASPPSPTRSSVSLDNLPDECLSEEEIKSLVKDEKYCTSTDSEEKAEQLLNFDTPGVANTWLYFRHYIASDPLCSTNPNATFLVINPTQISSHKFFQSRSIDIPIADGSIGIRRVEFRHMRVSKNLVWKRVLECECEMKGTEKNVRDICVEGRIVNLSRGVGGDRSFFVYKYNSLTGFYNVIAHICF